MLCKRWTLPSIAAIAALLALSGAAQASETIESSESATTATSPSLSIMWSSILGGISARCRVSLALEGIEQEIPNIGGALIARVSDAEISNTSGSERLCDSNIGPQGVELLGLPLHVRLVRVVLGESVSLVFPSFAVNFRWLNLGFECLYVGDLTMDGQLVGGSALTTLAANQTGIPLVSGSILCPSSFGLEGVFSLSPALSLSLR